MSWNNGFHLNRFIRRTLGFKTILVLFLFVQLFFSMFSMRILGTENVYPVYGWNIFHTRPDRIFKRQFVFIKKINDKTYSPPVDVFDLKDEFPLVDWYTFSRKIDLLADHFFNSDSRQLAELISNNLTLSGKAVEWDFVEITFEIIDYHLNRTYLERKILGEFVSVPQGPTQ